MLDLCDFDIERGAKFTADWSIGAALPRNQDVARIDARLVGRSALYNHLDDDARLRLLRSRRRRVQRRSGESQAQRHRQAKAPHFQSRIAREAAPRPFTVDPIPPGVDGDRLLRRQRSQGAGGNDLAHGVERLDFDKEG